MNQTMHFPRGWCLLLGDYKHPLRKGLVNLANRNLLIYRFCRLVIVVEWLKEKFTEWHKGYRLIGVALIAFEPLNTNQQSIKSVDQQNKSCLLSSPDPFQGGAYNLQLISATLEESGLVHETIVLVVHNTELDIFLKITLCA